jgi:hypothetical protein
MIRPGFLIPPLGWCRNLTGLVWLAVVKPHQSPIGIKAGFGP